MSSTVQRDKEIDTDPAKLEKLSKKELIETISGLQHQLKQDKRREQWGMQFDGWLIWASQKNTTVSCVLSQAIAPTDKNVFDSDKQGYRVIVGIPKRVDKYQIQFQLGDGSKIWVNKNFIITCTTFNKKDEENND